MSTPYENWRPTLLNRLLTILDEKQASNVLTLLEPQLAAWAEYENATNWHTDCTSCARVLDSCYQETIRAEKAEKELERYVKGIE